MSTASDLPGPPAIDYTSRDYLSIRDDLLALKADLLPEWTSESPNDFGIVLLELFAYISDSLHYYADRMGNEAYLQTATQRASVIRIARMMGYTPALPVAASATLTFANSTGAALTAPALTQVATTSSSSDSPVVFETAADLLVPANSSATVTANQGITVSGEVIGVSDGTVDQAFTLFNTGAIQGSVSVVVSTTTTWSYIPRLVTAGPFDQVFSLLLDDNDVVTVVFGDGANGAIPPTGATLTATYRIGAGANGNVAANALDTILTTVPAGLAVTAATAATGGADVETTDSIRTNAQKALTSLQRAVTLNDYASLAVQVAGCGKGSASSSVFTSVTVYVAPQGGGGYDGTNGITGSATSTLTSLISSVGTYLNTVKLANTTVTVLGPTYVPINVTAALHCAPQQSQNDAINMAADALNQLLVFDNVIFQDTISPGDVYLALSQVSGVLYSDLTVLSRTGSGMAAVSLAVNEIPTVGTVTVTATGGTA